MSCEFKSLAKLCDLTYVKEILGFSQGKSFVTRIFRTVIDVHFSFVIVNIVFSFR